MSELVKSSGDLHKLSIDELKAHIKALQKAGFAINYEAVKKLMSEESEEKEKRSVARKQIRQAYQNPPKKSSSASEAEESAEEKPDSKDLERYAELNKKAKRSKSGEDDLYHIANTLQVAGRTTKNKEELIWAIIEKEKKLAAGEEKITTKVRKNAAVKSPAAKIPAGAITESEPKKKKSASPKAVSPKASPPSSPKISPKAKVSPKSPKKKTASASQSASKSASASGSASGSASKSKTGSSSGGDADDANYCGNKNDFACPPGKVCSADARMCVSEKMGAKAEANTIFKGHKVVGSKAAIAKLKSVMARKCGAESYDAIASKSLEEIKKTLKAKGIDASKVTDKEWAIDLLCEYSTNKKTCDEKGKFACPDDMVCDISSKPGICVSQKMAEKLINADKAAHIRYKEHNIIGSETAIVALKKQLAKLNASEKAKIPAKKGPKYRRDPVTKEELIAVITALTGNSSEYYESQDVPFLAKLYKNLTKSHQNAMKLATKLSGLTGAPVETYDNWDVLDMQEEIERLENEEEIHVEENESGSEEAEEEAEEEEEKPVSKPVIKPAKTASIQQKMKELAVEDEEENSEDEVADAERRLTATPLPKPAKPEKPAKTAKPAKAEKPSKPASPKIKPKVKPTPKSSSSEASGSEEDAGDQISEKVQKIVKNIKAGKKAEEGTDISQYQQAIIKCLGLGA